VSPPAPLGSCYRDAARLIALDDADVMVAGGAESAVCRIGIAGFNACRALSTAYNDTPTKASRPYDKDRDGFVMGEGAGVVVLEELEHARARGAKIYGEVTGYGLSGDAYHITAPSEDGDGGFRAMQMALKRAGIAASDIDYVNAHGTSTMADGIELGAVERLLGNAASKTAMSSTNPPSGICRRGRCGGSHLLPAGDARWHGAAHHQSGQSRRHHCLGPGAAQGAEARRQHRHVNSFGFGGNQCRADPVQDLMRFIFLS